MEYYIINTDVKTIGKSPHTYWIEKGFVFTGGPYKYGKKLDRLNPGDIIFVYANRIGIVAIGEAAEKWDGKTYYDEPEIYQNPKEKIYKLKVKWRSEMGSRPITAAEIRNVGGRIFGQTLVRVEEGIASRILDLRKTLEMRALPEEIDEEEVFFEGAKTRIAINAYERNIEARSKCIDHYGPKCQVCGMSFKEAYGPEFERIIHVHHLRKISEIGESYVVNPISDLRPVCPNCHAAIHNNKEPFTIEEIKGKIRNKIFAT